MSLLFPARSSALERMDVEALPDIEMAQVLRALEIINAWLGGARATLGHLKRFSQRWPRGQIIRIVDWGTGGADIPRAIIRWARREGFHVEVVGIDSNPTVVQYAK